MLRVVALRVVALALAGAAVAAGAEGDVELGGPRAGWAAWRVTVDGVMGGRSTGTLTPVEDGAADFSGTISLVGGGFSSISTYDVPSAVGYAGLLLELECPQDRQTPLALQARLSASVWAHGASVALMPHNAGMQSTYFLPMEAFKQGPASLAGRECRSGCALDLDKVRGVQLYVLFQDGRFDVRLRRVALVREPPHGAVAGAAHGASVACGSSDTAGLLVSQALAAGMSLYNKGYPGLTAALYGEAARRIVACGQEDRAGAACAGLSHAPSAKQSTDRAWVLRRALDAASEPPGPAETSYPAVARGSWLTDGMNHTECLSAPLLPASTGATLAGRTDDGTEAAAGASAGVTGAPHALAALTLLVLALAH